jgi:hypothetical protein
LENRYKRNQRRDLDAQTGAFLAMNVFRRFALVCDGFARGRGVGAAAHLVGEEDHDYAKKT